MTRKRLLLFDIDGTLVNTGGAGVKSLRKMVQERFGVVDELADIEIAGKTDRAIIRDILQKYKTTPTAENMAALAKVYVEGLVETLPRSKGRVLPGIDELLGRLRKRPNIILGLLTGNLKEGARLKLGHYGLWEFFEFGAFADDHHDRNELGAFAHRRARQKHGHDFDAADIDVIGDTGHDIGCGKALGARTVAVATGSWSRQRLAKCAPDFLFDDFADVGKVMRRLGW
jgi:phosphoglycolate phosphatase